MRINVAYACNEAYMEQTSVSIISLFENNEEMDSIYIYFIDMGISFESASYLKKIVNRYDGTIFIISFMDIAYDLRIQNTGRHIQSVYAKLFFGRLKGIDRIIYLDSDTIVVDSLRPLWNLDLKGNVCAGVESIYSINNAKKLGLSSSDRIINDGIVLIDLEMWRSENYLQRCLKYIDSYNGEPPVLSEGTINAVCKGKILIISPRYNLLSSLVETKAKKIVKMTGKKYYSQEELDEAINNPCIIHFLSDFYNRPWCKYCTHPFKNRYLYYRKKTKWSDLPLQTNRLPIRMQIIGVMYKYLPIDVFLLIRKFFSKRSLNSISGYLKK